MTCRHCALVFSNLAMDESSSPRSSEEAGTPATAVARRQGRPSAPSQAEDASSGSYGGDLMRRSALASARATWPSLHNSESRWIRSHEAPARIHKCARAHSHARTANSHAAGHTQHCDAGLALSQPWPYHNGTMPGCMRASQKPCRIHVGAREACRPANLAVTLQQPKCHGPTGVLSRKARFEGTTVDYV
jgi:hypothetical protein